MDDFDASATQDYGDYDSQDHILDDSTTLNVELPACEICKSSTNQKDLYHCNDCRLFNHWECQGRSADDPNKPETTISIICSACQDMNKSAPKIDQPITKRKRPSSSLTNDSSKTNSQKLTAVSVSSDESEDSSDEDINHHLSGVLALRDDATKRRKIVQPKKSNDAETASSNLAASARKLAHASQSATPSKPTLPRKVSTDEKRKPSSGEKRSVAKMTSPVSKAPTTINQSTINQSTISKSPSNMSGPMLAIKNAIGGPNSEKITKAISDFTNQHFGPSERRNCFSRLVSALKNNDSLRQRVHDGLITPEQLCVMNENELASEEQQRERAEEAKQALQQVVIKETTIAKHTKEGIEYISVHGDKLERVDAFAPSPDDHMHDHNSDEDDANENGDHDHDDHHDDSAPFLDNEDRSTNLMNHSPLIQPLSLPDTPLASNNTNDSVTRRLSAVELTSPHVSNSDILPLSALEVDTEAASLPAIGSFVPDANESFDMTLDDGPTDNLFLPETKSDTVNTFSPTKDSSPSNNTSQSSNDQKIKREDIVDLSDDTDNTFRPSVVTPSVAPGNARIDSLISSDTTPYRPVNTSIAAQLLINQLGAHSEWKSWFKVSRPLQNIGFNGYLMGIAGQANDEESLNAMKALPRTCTINGRGKSESLRTALNDVRNANDRIASLYHLHVSPEDEPQMKQFCDSHEGADRIALADCRKNKQGLFIYIGRYSPRIIEPSFFHETFAGVASVKNEEQSYYAVVVYWPSKLASRSSSSKNQAVAPVVPVASAPIVPSLPAGFPAGPSPFFYPFPFFQPPAAVTTDGAAAVPGPAAPMQHPYQYPYPYPYPGMPMAPPAASPVVAPSPPIAPVAPVAPVAPTSSFQAPSPYPHYNSNPSNTNSNYNSSSNNNSNYNSNPNTSSYNNNNNVNQPHSSAAQFLSTISRTQPPQQQQQFHNHRPVSPPRGRSPMRHDDMRGRHSNTFSPRSQPRIRPRSPSPVRNFPPRGSTGQPMPDRGRSRSPRRPVSPVRGPPPRGYSPPASQFNRAGPPRSPPRHHSPPRSPPRHHSPPRRPSFSPQRGQQSRSRPFSPNRSPPRQRIDPRVHHSKSPVRSQQRPPQSPVRQPQAFGGPGTRSPPRSRLPPQNNPDEPIRTSGQIHPSRIGMAPQKNPDEPVRTSGQIHLSRIGMAPSR